MGLESLIRVNLRLESLIRDNFGLESLIRRKFGSGPQPGEISVLTRDSFKIPCLLSEQSRQNSPTAIKWWVPLT